MEKLTPEKFAKLLRLGPLDTSKAFVSLSPQFQRVRKKLTAEQHAFSGFGAPSAVAQAEILHARGVQEFFFFGSCGSLPDSQLKIGEVGYIARAWADEGTSVHYGPSEILAPAQSFAKRAGELGIPAWTTWTTDALFRETPEKIRAFQSKGCQIVEMEASALYAWASYRNVSAIIFAVVQDETSATGWQVDQNQEKLFDCLLPILRRWQAVSF